jgi:uncharacterized delta-60 repeat protein
MKKIILSLLLGFVLCSAFCQPGANDPLFNPDDSGNGFGDWFNGQVNAITLQADGKMLVGGNFTNYNGTAANRLARLNTDGTIDNTFQTGSGFNQGVTSIEVLASGKIMVGGYFTTYKGSQKKYLIRLNADGTDDPSFTMVSLSAGISCMAVQPDGKIVIGGIFFEAIKYLARVNSDGSLDATFASNTDFANTPGNSTAISDIALQADGKIVVVGQFVSIGGTGRNYVARLEDNGTLDASFDPGTGFNAHINAMSAIIDSDNKIIVVGGFDSYNGVNRKSAARITSTGALDLSFTPPPILSGFIYVAAIQSDNRIVIAGDFYTNGHLTRNLARLNTDGTLDMSHTAGNKIDSQILTLTLQSDGKAFTGGSFTLAGDAARRGIARYNTDGSIDNTIFNTPNTGINAVPTSITRQADGKLLVGGRFSLYNGEVRRGMVRITEDGQIDPSFVPDYPILVPGTLRTISIQPDSKIIIGGYLGTNYGAGMIARMNADGTFDTGFVPGIGGGEVISTQVQPDGKIIMSGTFQEVNGNDLAGIARLNNDGTTDMSFNPGTGANGIVFATALLPDGKILIAGNFSQVNSVSRKNVARLNADGTVDESFDAGGAANSGVYTIVLQADGKILVAGDFTTFANSNRSCIARLNSDGSLDQSFVPSAFQVAGSTPAVTKVLPAADGKIVIAVRFVTPNYIVTTRIARLHANGQQDESFETGTGFNELVYDMTLLEDDKIVAVGNFTNFNGTGRNRIARLLGGGIGTTVNTTTICTGQEISIPFSVRGSYNFQSNNIFTAQLSNAQGQFTTPKVIGTRAGTTSSTIFATIPIDLPAGTMYRVRVVSSESAITGSDNGVDITLTRLPLVISGDTEICKGESTQLVGSGASFLLWVNGPSIPTWEISPTQTTSYTLSGTEPTSGCVSEITQVVTVKDLPVVGISGGTPICEGSSTTLTASGATTYSWAAGATSATLNVSPTTTTSYMVTGTAANGCTDDESITIVVNARPAKPVIDADITDASEAVLTAPVATSYQWFRNETLIDGATAQTYFAEKSGNYTVEVEDANGCKSLMSDAVDIVITALEEQAQVTFSLHPNPANTSVTVSLKEFKSSAPVVITLIDTQGKTINTEVVEGATELRVDLGRYQPGLYYMHARQGHRSAGGKFVKR